MPLESQYGPIGGGFSLLFRLVSSPDYVLSSFSWLLLWENCTKLYAARFSPGGMAAGIFPSLAEFVSLVSVSFVEPKSTERI